MIRSGRYTTSTTYFSFQVHGTLLVLPHGEFMETVLPEIRGYMVTISQCIEHLPFRTVLHLHV